MRILVSGASGFLGSRLLTALAAAGHQVGRIVRSAPAAKGDVLLDAASGTVDAAGCNGSDAVVHLMGENIAEGRWTRDKKRRIRSSRVDTTRLLAATLAALDRPPATLVAASAIGYYGDRGEELLGEPSGPGTGFLAEVCRDWEAAAEPARACGLRVVHLRFGVILDPAGGALAKMLTPFRLGAGGRIGHGRQWVSWIAREDAVRAIESVLGEARLRGAVNVVSPQPVRNQELTRLLGRALRRPTVLPMPVFAARLAFGEMADAALLASARVTPAQLQAVGFAWRHPDLKEALASMLGGGR